MGNGPTTQDILAERSHGTMSAEMAVLRLLLCHRDLEKTAQELAAIDSGPARKLGNLLRVRAEAAATILCVADRADSLAGPTGLEEALERCAQFFDWAVDAHPEASVALYSLGTPELLAAATREVVELMARRDVLGWDKQLLDIGCGIGRIEAALEGRIRCAIGIDVSHGMIAKAQERCVGQGDTAFQLTSGRDLRPFADASFDTVTAIDSFPYVFQAGGAKFACAYFAEIGRVLQPGGDILILNLSYRGQPELDRMDAIRFGRENGLDLYCNGASELHTWDGRTLHWRKPSL